MDSPSPGRVCESGCAQQLRGDLRQWSGGWNSRHTAWPLNLDLASLSGNETFLNHEPLENVKKAMHRQTCGRRQMVGREERNRDTETERQEKEATSQEARVQARTRERGKKM